MPTTEAEVSDCISTRNAACENRLFFVTRNGSLGLGPAQMRTGDMVFVLMGSAVLFILLQEFRYLDSHGVIHLPDEEKDHQENRVPKGIRRISVVEACRSSFCEGDYEL
jgi:hypothetical protein